MVAQTSEIQAVRLCPVDLLFPHPHNPRGEVDPATVQELADSIREKGVLEPLIVVPHPEKSEGYLVVAGHRRRAASILAGLNGLITNDKFCFIRTVKLHLRQANALSNKHL